MKEKIKVVFKFAFTILFIWFSALTLSDFHHGKISYEILKEKETELRFPSLTLCPSQDGALVSLNINKMLETLPGDLNNFNRQDQSIWVQE